MHCLYCSHVNPEDEHRCQRWGRRLRTPHAPRTLKTSVEAVIYCDAPVATLAHRAVAFALDFSIVVMAIGVFLLAFRLCGGEFAKVNVFVGLGFGSAFLGIALFYGALWA